VAIRPGISFSASSISRRPKAAKLISATLNLSAGAAMIEWLFMFGRGGGCVGKKSVRAEIDGSFKETFCQILVEGLEKSRVQSSILASFRLRP
jgi:hypothetical protein